MRTEIKKQYINELSITLKKEGFRVFVSSSGTYGFFTNEVGDRVVSFQVDDLSYAYSFSGNYYPEKASNGVRVGRGWRLDNNLSFKNMIASNAPQWAIGNHKVNYTTLDKHLKTYQKSSQFIELV